ncbi:MAG: hypothetical protein SNJ75_11980, partial [Gemmataceae bacterium]
MNFQVDVSSSFTTTPVEKPLPLATPAEMLEVLRQLLEIQREQLQLARQAAAAADHGARWRSFIARWQEEFPELAKGCRAMLPKVERAYAQLVSDLLERLENDELDSDFALQEFIDRFGMRLAQMGTILNVVGQI